MLDKFVSQKTFIVAALSERFGGDMNGLSIPLSLNHTPFDPQKTFIATDHRKFFDS